MRYQYKAKEMTGTVVEGVAEATDKFALVRDLRKKGLTVIERTTEEDTEKTHILHFFRERFSRVRYVDILQFFDNLATMLAAGLSLSRALTVLLRQARTVAMQKCINAIIKEIDQGRMLADSLAGLDGVFSQEAIALVKAGESSGTLPKTLKRIAATMKRRFDIMRKIKGAMIYPAIVVMLMVAIGFFMLVVVVPPLTQTFEAFNVELPLLTRTIIVMGTVVSEHIVLTFFVLISVVYGTYRAVRSAKGMYIIHTWVLKVPGLAPLAREYYAGTSMRTFSGLLTAGIDIVEALEITANAVANHQYKNALMHAQASVQKGIPVHAIFLEREDLFPPFVSEMAEVGGETGLLAKMLDQAAGVYEEHISATTKNVSSIIEPVLMIIIGLFVALFAIAVIDPLYSLTDSLK